MISSPRLLDSAGVLRLVIHVLSESYKLSVTCFSFYQGFYSFKTLQYTLELRSKWSNIHLNGRETFGIAETLKIVKISSLIL